MGEVGEGEDLPSKENQDKNKIWNYEQFSDYLYRISLYGKEGTGNLSRFPAFIELNDQWYNTLDRMREETRDGRERWMPIGMRKDKLPEFLHEDFLIGDRNYVHYPTSPEKIEQLWGVSYYAGDLHTHSIDMRGFSAGDFYNLLTNDECKVKGLVEFRDNYFAFKTQETKEIPDSLKVKKGNKFRRFERYWYGKFGLLFYYRDKNYNSYGIEMPKSEYKVVDMDKSIAETYNLALYYGFPRGNLFRYYPP